MMKLVIATRNPHKLDEIRATLPSSELFLLSALDFPEIPEVIEDGATLEENAVKKSETLCRLTGLPALADDSGLEVDALDGAPGVFSARWAGEDCSYENNNKKLLRELNTQSNRRAQFRTVIALSRPGLPTETVEGRVQGWIVREPRGHLGFGYDPLFVPDGFNQTFAELPTELKNKISHRARALQAAATVWNDFFSGQ